MGIGVIQAKQEEKFKIQPIENIVNGPYNQQNHSLDFFKNYRWDEIIKHRDWQDVISLSFNFCYFTQQNMQLLRKLKWENMKQLRIKQANLDKQLKILFSFNLSHLTELNLSCNTLKLSGIKMLSKTNLDSLKKLFLINSKLQNQSFKHLAKGNYKSLQDLVISSNRPNLDGLLDLSLISSKCLTSLNLNYMGQKSAIGLFIYKTEQWGYRVSIDFDYYKRTPLLEQIQVLFRM